MLSSEPILSPRCGLAKLPNNQSRLCCPRLLYILFRDPLLTTSPAQIRLSGGSFWQYKVSLRYVPRLISHADLWALAANVPGRSADLLMGPAIQ